VAAFWPASAPPRPWAAVHFAIHHGHAEAVMWFRAANKLLLFCFGPAFGPPTANRAL